MKIAFFVAEFPILSETFVIRQVAGLVRAGHQVTVIAGQWGDRECRHETYLAHQLESLVQPVRLDLASTKAKLLRLASFAWQALMSRRSRKHLGVALRAAWRGSWASLLDIAATSTSAPTASGHLGSYDTIIAHFGTTGVRAMHLQQAGLLEGPLAVVFHGFDMSDHATLAQHKHTYQDLFKHAARLLPISELWQQRLLHWGAPQDRIEVLRMGVDLDRLTALDPSRPLNTPLRVLSVARLTEKKGLRYAIEAVLSARVPIHYEIIGHGPLSDELQTLASAAPPDKTILFSGQKNQQDVFAALERSDVFLLPSVTASGGDMEGIPVSLMEAMAKGILVLATAHSGIPELITHQESGLLVPERDAIALSRCLDVIAHKQLDIPAVRAAARASVEKNFDNKNLDQKILNIASEMRRN